MIEKRYSIEELKEVIAPIAEKYHLSKVYLFGSFARGDYNELSDIDLRIEKGELKGMFCFMWILYRSGRSTANESGYINHWKFRG